MPKSNNRAVVAAAAAALAFAAAIAAIAALLMQSQRFSPPPPVPAASIPDTPAGNAAAGVVPAAVFDRHSWLEGEVFTAKIFLSNRSGAPFTGSMMTMLSGDAFADSRTDKVSLALGETQEVCTFFGPDGDGALATYEGKTDRMTLLLSVYDAAGKVLTRAQDEIWAFPNHLDEELDNALAGTTVVRTPEDALAALAKGGRVLLLRGPEKTTAGSAPASPFPPPASPPPPVVAADLAHPLFKTTDLPFPARAVEPWSRLLKHAAPVPLPPRLRAIANFVAPSFSHASDKDGTFTSGCAIGATGALIFECAVAGDAAPQGRLLALCVGESALRLHPEGRHLLLCVAQYMRSPEFRPPAVPPALLRETLRRKPLSPQP
ncbi:MAG: hypothetical protein LBR07_00515 [Puniceicoccales bacterium]|jgi:hypothetical protein|nr:hypothetical protein [Puniceicoccales bacterium]